MDFNKLFIEYKPWAILVCFLLLCIIIYFTGTMVGFISPNGIIANKKLSVRSDIDTTWNTKEFEKAIASINS